MTRFSLVSNKVKKNDADIQQKVEVENKENSKAEEQGSLIELPDPSDVDISNIVIFGALPKERQSEILKILSNDELENIKRKYRFCTLPWYKQSKEELEEKVKQELLITEEIENPLDESYDCGVKVENAETKEISSPKVDIKVATALVKKEGVEAYDRACSSTEKHRPMTFQQVKIDCYDYIFGVVIYKDKIDVYLIPTKDISRKLGKENKESGKLTWCKQHKGHTSEGLITTGKSIGPYKIRTFTSKDDFNNKISLKAEIERLHGKR